MDSQAGRRRLLSTTFARAENSLDHDDEHNAALIPAAQPTHAPAVDLISQPSLSEKSYELRFYTHISQTPPAERVA